MAVIFGSKNQNALNGERNATIAIESQLLAVGGGFIVFIALLAFLATVQRRKRRRHEFQSPLIQEGKKSGHLSPSDSFGIRSINPGVPPVQQIKPFHYPGNGRNHSAQLQMQSPVGSESGLSSSMTSSSLSSCSSGGSNYSTPFVPYSTPLGVANVVNNYQLPVVNGYQQPFLKFDLVDQLDDGKRGTMTIQLQYDAGAMTLQVVVVRCGSLPYIRGADGHHSMINPYVKMRLLPDGKQKMKTRILRETRDPHFDESFTLFGLCEKNLINCQLHFAVLAFDRFNRDAVLGESLYNLKDLFHNAVERKIETILELNERKPFDEDRGKALISMTYDQESNGMILVINQLKDLPEDKSIGLLDPYAKIYASVNGKRVAKFKTKVKRKTRNARFEESFEFNPSTDVTLEESALSFLVLVLNHDGVKRNEPVGKFTVDTNSDQLVSAFQSPGQTFEEWHQIQPF